MVFHVTATQNAARVHVLKSREDFFRRALGHLHNNVQPTAVAHAHDEFHRALLPGGIQNFIHQRDHGGHAFERKPLAAEIALLQHLLEEVGPDKLVEHPLLVHIGLRPFHALLDPATPFRVSNMHEFRAYGSAVDAAGLFSQLAFDTQAGMRLRGAEIRAGRDRPPGIPSGEKGQICAHVRRLELRAHRSRQIHLQVWIGSP